MDISDIKKLPRLYVDRDLAPGQTFALPGSQAHYLRSVLRQNAGNAVRLFNGRDGEWLGLLQTVDKKSVTITPDRQLAPQPPAAPDIHLLFAPIKKTRLDFLIEKSVELGVTRLRPVLTRNTENRHLNDERIMAQIAEAAEQCERLDHPGYTLPVKLEEALAAWPVEIPLLACLERTKAKPMLQAIPQKGPCAILTGPEGGFTADEVHYLLSLPFVVPVSLGSTILRSETAACTALAAITLSRSLYQ